MAVKRRINLKGGMSLLIYEKSIMLKNSAYNCFLNVSTDSIPEDAYKALGKMIESAYKRGQRHAKEEIKEAHSTFIKSMN